MVLLVEDEEMVRKSRVPILHVAGYSVLEADGPDDALRICADPAVKIDLLLTDVVMPKLSGRDLLTRVQEARAVRAVFVSGYADDAVVRHGILESNVSFLSKPFTRKSLLANVRQVLDAQLQGHSAQPPPPAG